MRRPPCLNLMDRALHIHYDEKLIRYRVGLPARFSDGDQPIVFIGLAAPQFQLHTDLIASQIENDLS